MPTDIAMLRQGPGRVVAWRGQHCRRAPLNPLSAVQKSTRSGFTLSGSSNKLRNLPFSIVDDVTEAPPTPAGRSLLAEWSDAVPARTKLVLACASSFMLSNMDKVNMTVAIIPMAQEMGWSSTESGLIQSSFFWGFLLAQVPGGYLCSTFGGAKMLPPSVAMWSSVTTLLPLAVASSMPALCLTRSVVGVGEAVAPSAIVDMLARTVPKEQRAGAVSAAFSGLHYGSILGLLVSPIIIEHWGWRSLFATYGVLGAAWFFAFKAMLRGMGEQDPEVLRLLEAPRQQGAATARGGHIPYRAMLRYRPVQALMFTHMAHNWFSYTMLAWLPTYFTSTLSIDLTHAAHTALLPPLAGVVASAIAGRAADYLTSTGVPLATVRKLAQCSAFVVPSALLAVTCANDAAADPTLNIACITAALGTCSFSLAGLYCTHQDLSPKYASAMLGLTNTAAAMPGIVGVALVGMLLDQTGGSWELALFAPSAVMMLLGAGVYTVLGRNDATDFDSAEHDDSPFLWEARLAPVGRLFDRVKSWATRSSS